VDLGRSEINDGVEKYYVRWWTTRRENFSKNKIKIEDDEKWKKLGADSSLLNTMDIQSNG